MQNFDGKTAFITGGAGGIGFSIAKSLGDWGAKIMVSDLSEERLQKAVAELGARGVEADYVVCDVADAASVDLAAQRTLGAVRQSKRDHKRTTRSPAVHALSCGSALESLAQTPRRVTPFME